VIGSRAPRLDWAPEAGLFAATLVAHASAVALGLDRVTAARPVARAIGLAGNIGFDAAPLGLLAMRAAAFFPAGDLAARANLVSAVLMALAIALIGRCARECLSDAAAGTGAPEASDQVGSRRWLAAITSCGAAAAIALSLSVWREGASAGPGAAAFALLAFVVLQGTRVLRDPAAARAGMALAFAAGLCTGTLPIVALITWPPFLLISLWALRRGERWPLFAPPLLMAGTGVALFAVAAGDGPARMSDLLALFAPRSLVGGVAGLFAGGGVPWGTVVGALGEVAEEIGVIAVLLAAIGAVVLVSRAPLASALAAWIGAASLGKLGAEATPYVIVAAALPLAAGMMHLSSKLGRAAPACAAALALMAAVSPALDGGMSARWLGRDGRAAAAAPRLAAPGGRDDVAAVLEYATRIGLRPDVAAAPPIPPAPHHRAPRAVSP
jgi:hypothetical protein